MTIDRIDRRKAITLIGATALAPFWSSHLAQAQAKAVIGFLHAGSAGPLAHLVAALRQGLKDAGYTEGQNLTIESRWADGHYEKLPAMANELVRRRVTLIVAGGEASATAAKGATSSIPIVFNIGSDPVKAGLVKSLNRPGGNVTGVNILASEIAAKRLGLLNDLVPMSSAIAVLVNPRFPPSATALKDVEAAAPSIKRRVLPLKATNEAEIDAAFATLVQMRAGAVLVGTDPFFQSRRDQFVALTKRHAIPAAYDQREFVQAGGLMSYGANIAGSYKRMAEPIGKILKGAKPGELPVIELSKFELVINLKTAAALGLTIPSSMIAVADDVIE